MDNSSVNIVLEKKLNDYNSNNEDFLAPQELTVTISLSEYRDLVSKSATREAAINEANSEKWKYRNENEKLKEEVAKLKGQLYELTTEYELTMEKEEGAK